MKKLDSVAIDGHVVEIEAHRNEGGILFVATCEGIRRESFMNMHIDSVSSKEQHAINVKEHVERLAKEAAGHHQNEQLLDDFFAKEDVPT
jgi:hypothetical protein